MLDPENPKNWVRPRDFPRGDDTGEWTPNGPTAWDIVAALAFGIVFALAILGTGALISILFGG